MKSVIVTADEAKGLMCPFTGKPLVVHMNVAPGSVTFNAPDAFSAHEPAKDYDTLMRRLSMRNGIEGVVTGGAAMIDPYSGEKFRFRDLPDGRVTVCGGFNPRAAKFGLAEFTYFASMRDGKTSRRAPAPPEPVTKVKSPAPRSPGSAPGPSDELQQACLDSVLSSGFEKPTVVSMSVEKGRRKGGSKK